MASESVATEATKPARKPYAYEVAQQLGMTLAELVGPENVDMHPANRGEAIVIERFRELTPAQQEAFVAYWGARIAGALTAEAFEGLAALTHEQCWERIMAWRASITAEQLAQYLRCMHVEAAA